MKMRKPLALLLCMALVLGSVSVAFAAGETVTATNAVQFTDAQGHWAKTAIEKWAGYGVVNGYEGFFRPDDSITRGEMAVILDNLMDYQVTAKNSFTDLQAGAFYTDAILKANAAGIIKGDGATVRPTDKITREEAAVIMARAFAVAAGTANQTKFADASSISSWAMALVYGMESKSYVQGYEGKFNPKNNVSRAEIVTMMNNIVKAYYTKAGTYTESVAGTAVVKVADVILKGVTISENLIIAEGVGQGDATLDTVTVKGKLVVRGGGENTVEIKGTSSISTVTIEKVGDKLRVMVADGATVKTVDVAAGEEIVITGTVGTVVVAAQDVTVYATAAVVTDVNVSGANSKVIVDAASKIDKITATAPVAISGTGTVTKVDLNAGAAGSSITTPKSELTVASGVTGVTGTGGTAIPAGSTGTNGTSATAPATTETVAAGGGGGGGGAETINHPDLAIVQLKWNGSVVATSGSAYQISEAAIDSSSNTAIGVQMSGDGFQNSNYTIKVRVDRISPNAQYRERTVSGVPGSLINSDYEYTALSLVDWLDRFESILGFHSITGTDINPVPSSLTDLLQNQNAGAKFKVTFTYLVNGVYQPLDGGTFEFDII